MKPRILFVDDDPYVLQGLRRMLRPMRDSWDFTFTESAREALQCVEKDAYAVLISDLRMPDMDGISFFSHAKKVSSKSVRIVLSGYADRDNTIQAVKEAQIYKFLVKPCKADLLTDAIRDGIISYENGNKEQEAPAETPPAPKCSRPTTLVEDIIAKFNRGDIDLPGIPQVIIKFRELMSQDAGVREIAGVLKNDPAIYSQLIAVSNSAYYRGVDENRTIEDAIMRLGLEVTKQYVDAIFNRSLYVSDNKNFAEVMERLWEHSLACACVAQTTADELGLSPAEDIFTLGLLHDIGKLVLLRVVGECKHGETSTEKENTAELVETISLRHGKFGASVLKRWRFSKLYAEVAQYHGILEEAESISRELLVVHFSNALAKSMGYSTGQQSEVVMEDVLSVRLLGLEAERINVISGRVAEMMAGVKGALI